MIEVYRLQKRGLKTSTLLKPVKYFDLEPMATNNKAAWRTAWINEFVASCPNKNCNVFTLPGPQALDVKEIRLQANVHSEVLVEKSKICTRVLYDSIQEPRTVREADVGLQRLLRKMAKKRAVEPVILNVRFETLMSRFHEDLEALLEDKFAPHDTVFCLDFCGMYTEKQHTAITRFVELTSHLTVLKGCTLWYILNFLSPYTFKTEDKRLGLGELRSFAGLETRAFRAVNYPSVQDSIQKFGKFLEGIIPRILQDACLGKEVESTVTMKEPLHYQNGTGRVAIGYTTNIFTLKGAIHGKEQEDHKEQSECNSEGTDLGFSQALREADPWAYRPLDYPRHLEEAVER